MRAIVFGPCAILAMALACCPPSAFGQPGNTGYSYSVTPVYHWDSDFDREGDASFAGLFLTLGHTWALEQGNSLGWRAHFDYENWRFSDATAFGTDDPWDNFYRYGVSIPWFRVARNGWMWNFTPTLGYAGESGADFSDSIEYGATLAAIRPIRPGLTLGLGFGFFRRIEDNFAFPMLVVDWRINDKWRLANPAPAGPAGPAGLELSYDLGGGWDIGFGATQRSERHRLGSDGPVPDGVGEHEFTLVFGRISRRVMDTGRLGLYLGADTNTKYRIEDSQGRQLVNEDADPAVMLGISLVGRF